MAELTDRFDEDSSGNEVRINEEARMYGGEDLWGDKTKLILVEIQGNYFFVPKDLKIPLDKSMDPSQVSRDYVERCVLRYILAQKIIVALNEALDMDYQKPDLRLWEKGFELTQAINSGEERGQNLRLSAERYIKSRGKVELSVGKDGMAYFFCEMGSD